MEGIDLSWAIISLAELTECTEKNNKNPVISAGSVRRESANGVRS